MQTDFLAQFRTARRCGVPLVAIRTPDPASTIRAVAETFTEYKPKKGADPGCGFAYLDQASPILIWDAVRGLHELRTSSDKDKETPDTLQLKKLLGNQPRAATRNPVATLVMIEQADERALIFLINPQEFWKEPVISQGIWNLRDVFKATGATVVLLTTRGAILPPILAEDVVVLDQPLPNPEELAEIVKNVYGFVDMPLPKDESTMPRATDALLGLGAFPAEQSAAMELTPQGLDTKGLWGKKRQIIGQVRGLSVMSDPITFADLGGLRFAKEFYRRYFDGPDRPDGIVFTDELEKLVAGFGTDSSGTTTKSVGALCTFMETHKIKGGIFYGQRGSGKTALVQAIVNEFGILGLNADWAAMESGLVGSTGENIRAAFSVIAAMFRNPLFIGTINTWGQIPPELRRRYNRLPIMYFDLPDEQERAAIWPIHVKANDLSITQRPRSDDSWTGAEIRNCCELAKQLRCTVQEAAVNIIPLAESDSRGVTELRVEANGKYISASYGGKYQYDPDAPRKARSGRRMEKEVTV